MSFCLSVRLIPLSLVAEELAVLACDLVPIRRGSSESGLVFRPFWSQRAFPPEPSFFLLLLVGMEFPSRLGNTSLDLNLAEPDQALLEPVCKFPAGSLLGRSWKPLFLKSASVLDLPAGDLQSKLLSRGDFPVLPWPPPGTFSSDRDLLLPEDLELALLQGRWVPFTWTGEVGVAEDPIEESRRDSDLWMDLAEPELMEPVPGNIQSINVWFLYL